MGFHEDDRIRRKNAEYNQDATQNEAETLYSQLRALRYSDHDIVRQMTNLVKLLRDDIRNEIRLAVIEIARRSLNEQPKE
jgi:aspartate/glutamate racemase